MIKRAISNIQNVIRIHQAKTSRLSVSDIVFAPFFIVSSGRSGTTLLRRMLTAHHQLHIPPESDDLIPRGAQFFAAHSKKEWKWLVLQVCSIFETAPCFAFWKTDLSQIKEPLINLPPEARSYAAIVNAIYKHHAFLQGKSSDTWGDKTPYLVHCLDWLRLIFPNARYIFVVRDGRAVVHSMIKKQGYTLRQAAVRWRDSVLLFNAHTKKIEPDHQICIHYEDLVGNTQQVLKNICDFLKVPFLQELSSSIPENMGDTVLSHHENTSKPVSKDHLTIWKQELEDKQIQYLNTMLRKELLYFRYVE